jgi:hypothetical protein
MEMARVRFPDDELAAEIAARKAFDVEESATYVADLDAQVEEQGVLEAVRTAMRLREELREDLREKGLGASGNEVDDDYIHLDDADDLNDLPGDNEAEDAAAEQRTLVASLSLPTGSRLPRGGQRRIG